MDIRKTIFEFVRLMIETRQREAYLPDGSKVSHGSPEHIDSLQKRLSELDNLRQHKPRGSEARATYSRLITHLKRELSSAIKASKNRETTKSVEDIGDQILERK